jgi:hypothetical protein
MSALIRESDHCPNPIAMNQPRTVIRHEILILVYQTFDIDLSFGIAYFTFEIGDSSGSVREVSKMSIWISSACASCNEGMSPFYNWKIQLRNRELLQATGRHTFDILHAYWRSYSSGTIRHAHKIQN